MFQTFNPNEFRQIVRCRPLVYRQASPGDHENEYECFTGHPVTYLR